MELYDSVRKKRDKEMKIPEERLAVDYLIQSIEKPTRSDNGVYVFMETMIPYKKDEQGIAELECFYDINEHWMQVGECREIVTTDGDKRASFLYAYCNDKELAVLEKDDKTQPLFDKLCVGENTEHKEIAFAMYTFIPEIFDDSYHSLLSMAKKEPEKYNNIMIDVLQHNVRKPIGIHKWK